MMYDTMYKVGFGVIGAGYWGPHLIRNVSDNPDARLVSIADLSLDRLQALQRRYPHVAMTQNHRELLDDPEVDAVILATPVKTHYALAKEAMEAGKHVLIEKPMVRKSTEAQDLIHLAAQRDLVLMVGHTFEYNPAVVSLRDIVKSGQIGTTFYVDAARLNLGQFRTDVNVIWDLAPHDISIMNFILESEPTHVSARGNSCIHEHIHDVAYIEMKYPQGITGHIHVSWLEPCKVRRFTVVGDEKMVVYNDVAAEEKLRIYDKGVIKTTSSGDFADFQLGYHYGGVHIPAVPGGEPLKLEIAHFIECIVTGVQPRTDGWSGLRVTRVLEAADKSLQNGGSLERIATNDSFEMIKGAGPAWHDRRVVEA